jgi:tRNA-splicing ligase RtcB
MSRRADPSEIRARELCLAAGIDPDSRVEVPHKPRGMPAWCDFRDVAKAEFQAADLAAKLTNVPAQASEYQNSPLEVVGTHEAHTIAQMRGCMAVGNVAAAVICADGHVGYSQPVGGVVAYECQISISGVGFDIACGNHAIKLDVQYADIKDRVPDILADIRRVVSFGVGRNNDEKVEHELFDDIDAWKKSDRLSYRQKAINQLGTVGSGNHYVDLFEDEAGFVWIGNHFGSRGLGHTSAMYYLQLAGGRDEVNAPPTIVDEGTEIFERYLTAMELAGRYAYAGREWVAQRVRKIIGGQVMDSVHNNHNYADLEVHNGRRLWVVRKGATPAFPGQRGFVGGSMGDNAVILKGVDSEASRRMLYSTVHGSGRVMSRTKAKNMLTRTEMDAWLKERGVLLAGGEIDESPMVYRRLPEVLAHHEGTIKVLHSLRPFAVAMAGEGDVDPFKD